MATGIKELDSMKTEGTVMRFGSSACWCILLLMCGLTVSAAETPIKNVLFIISDDLKASALGPYGNEICKTPNIDRLAARGMVFERAYCQGTWCQPSRISFMRSRYVGLKGITVGEHVRAAGIHSARVGKIFHMRVPGDIIAGTDGEDVAACWDEKYNASGQEAHTPGNYACLNKNIFTTELEGRESTKMKNRMFVTVDYVGDGSDQPDFKAADKTIELLRQNRDKPFFIATGFVRPHYPNVAPVQYFNLYDYTKLPLPIIPEDDLADIPKIGWAGSRSDTTGIGEYPDNIKRMWAGYYATVTFMDAQVGRLLDELEKLNLHNNTAVIFTSDHGYHLGEHTFWQKSNLHEDVTRVPLIVSIPGQTAGRSRSLVELVDIYPTICESIGLTIPNSVQGKSLVPVIKDPTHQLHEGAISILPEGQALRSDKWAYILYKDGSEELYDMDKDPYQFSNVAKDPMNKSLCDAMRLQIQSHPFQADMGAKKK